MNVIVEFIMKHGYSVLFGAVFVHQIGLPVPGPLFLLAAGALAAAGKLGLAAALGLAVVACVLADWLWYEAGRLRGEKVLHFIHRFAPNPDAADQQGEKDLCPVRASYSRFMQVRPGTGRDSASPGRDIPHQPSPIPHTGDNWGSSLFVRICRARLCLQP